MDVPREPESETRPFTPEDYLRLRNSAAPAWIKDLAEFTLLTGCAAEGADAPAAAPRGPRAEARDLPTSGEEQEVQGRGAVRARGRLPLRRRNGNHLDSSYRRNRLSKAFIKLMKELELPYSFRSLRTTAGSWADDSGVDLRSIQKTLGHASVTTTEQAYAKGQAERTRDSVRAVEAVLTRAARKAGRRRATGNKPGISPKSAVA